MEHSRTRAWVLGLVAVVLLSATAATSQPMLPHENHYKVYVTNVIPYTKPVTLIDQFGPINAVNFNLDRFANPTEKIHPDGTGFPMVNPDVHLTWWRFHVPQPPRTVVGIDQFGISQWHLGDAVYLLNPALKNVPLPAQPPIWNHYVCYEAVGPSLGRPVILVDQFGTCNVVVLHGKLFCNPVQKHADGRVYPIIDHAAHLTCYLVQNPTPFARQVTAVDQFGVWQLQAYQNDCLCVPALKEHVVKTEESTWGRIKAMYR